MKIAKYGLFITIFALGLTLIIANYRRSIRVPLTGNKETATPVPKRRTSERDAARIKKRIEAPGREVENTLDFVQSVNSLITTEVLTTDPSYSPHPKVVAAVSQIPGLIVREMGFPQDGRLEVELANLGVESPKKLSAWINRIRDVELTARYAKIQLLPCVVRFSTASDNDVNLLKLSPILIKAIEKVRADNPTDRTEIVEVRCPIIGSDGNAATQSFFLTVQGGGIRFHMFRRSSGTTVRRRPNSMEAGTL